MTDPLTTVPGNDAIISGDGRYRYVLKRRWGRGAECGWIMLNPSTADAAKDDPTIRRIVDFSRRWGFGAAKVVNLFGLRATNPAELAQADDPVGPANDDYVEGVLRLLGTVVVAWGAHPMAVARANEVVLPWLRHRGVLECLGMNQDGSPKHPLYVPKAARLIVWR